MTDYSEPNGVAELTAKIVSAYVSNNAIAQSELPELITTVAGRLRKVGAEPEQPVEERRQPAVSVRQSIRLKRHLAVKHGLTPAQYRERFDLKPDYPMAAPNYAQQRREFALRTGLGRPKKPARRAGRSSVRVPKAEPSAAATA